MSENKTVKITDEESENLQLVESIDYCENLGLFKIPKEEHSNENFLEWAKVNAEWFLKNFSKLEDVMRDIERSIRRRAKLGLVKLEDYNLPPE
jgi:hypothetical protein